MIRFVTLFSILATPMAAQTALEARPGLWLSVPQTDAPVLEAPQSGPLITATPAPSIDLIVPDAPADAVILVTPQDVPTTRPVPRPREVVADVPDVVVPVEVAAPVEVAVVEGEVAPEVVLPEPVAAAPNLHPRPGPETETTAAMAEALAAQIAAEAREIVTTAPRFVPEAEEIAEADALAPVPVLDAPEVATMDLVTPELAARAVVAPAAASQRPVAPAPAALPMVASAFGPATRAEIPLPMSAVLLPVRATPARPAVQPVAFVMPPLERAPILPRLRPSGPAALEGVTPLGAAEAAPLSAVLLPSDAAQATAVPWLTRSPAPAYDPFPMSALPPTALPEGPDSLLRAIQPPRPFAEANAAVLTGQPSIIPARLPIPAPSEAPVADAPVTDPDAPVELPAPDANAIARMVEDAMICWRMADLSVEAQWARLSVDVALDETNMPSAPSIRLTGFARVVSGAAEDAYRAAQVALVGCAEATGNDPATTATTLVFDRDGVRLQ